MGGFTSVLATAAQIAGGLSAQNDRRRQQSADLRHLQARQAQDYARASDEAERRRAEYAQKAQADETARQAALKRAMARQQARFGASGITPGGSGSAQAVLLGLFEESEEEKRQREALDTLRRQALDSDLAHRWRVNVLELDALRARQKIGGATSWANTLARMI